MPAIEYSGIKITLDDDGYLVNHEDWNELVAGAGFSADDYPVYTFQIQFR